MHTSIGESTSHLHLSPYRILAGNKKSADAARLNPVVTLANVGRSAMPTPETDDNYRRFCSSSGNKDLLESAEVVFPAAPKSESSQMAVDAPAADSKKL